MALSRNTFGLPSCWPLSLSVSHAWLADTGLNAEEHLIKEADEARARGSRSEHVDLARFVCDAVRLDGGRVQGQLTDTCFIIYNLSNAWLHGLKELPGYDAEQRLIRLTTRIDITTDEQGNAVGFLGRAHPLVRRAIDRVRAISFGANTLKGQDQRVSAVQTKVLRPELLFTFLGRVNRHKREGNPKVKCNALYKKQGNFNCKLKPNEAILLARNLLQKAQLILEEDLQDGTVHLWCTGQESEILYCGVQPARKSARRKAKSK